MKRALRKPEERASSNINDLYYYESDELYNYESDEPYYNGTAKRTKQDVHSKQNSNIPKKLEKELKTLKEENEKLHSENRESKDVIKNLEAQLEECTTEISNVEILKKDYENIHSKNEEFKLIIKSLELQLKKYASEEIEKTENGNLEEIVSIHDDEVVHDSCAKIGEVSSKADDTVDNVFESIGTQDNNVSIHEEMVEDACAGYVEVSSKVEETPDNVLESIGNGKITEDKFSVWDISLKKETSFLQMKSFYLEINLKNENAFIKECINKTFSPTFIQKIHFDYKSPFNDSNILLCLIKTIQEKFPNAGYDDLEARSKIVAAFRRFRNSASKKNVRN